MNKKSTLLLVLLLVPTLSLNSTGVTVDDDHGLPPAPILENLNDTGTPANSFIYQNNTGINIRYKADRFDVEGLILLGQGSNLTEDLNNVDYLVNFTKVSSFQENSFYETALNITSYTYFYAYGWSGTLDNGTMEELDLFGDAPGHELWIEEGKLFPDFVSASNTDDRDGDLYLPLNTNTTIEYRVRNNENNTAEYLSFVTAENETALYNSSMSSVVNMTRTNYTTIGEANFSIFQLELNMTSPILYFTAFNDRGWERSDGTTPVFHRLFNGFSFNLTYSESVSLYTNLDAISWNITTFNQTDDMSVGYQYRYFENDTAEEALLNWTTIDNLVNSTNDVHVNSSADGTLQINSTRLSTYNVTLSESFNVSNLVEVRSFVKYGSGSNITTDVQQIIVIDPNPIIAISNKNGTYTRAVNATILFDISTPKGELVTVTMEQFLPDNSSKTVFDLVDKQNQTILFAFSDTNDTILDGNHTVVINATNSIGQSTVVSFTLIVDRTNPTGTLSSASETTVSSGRVTVDLSGQDVGDGSGIQIMTLDWGDNVTINVTSLSSASHTYRTSGTYSITLTVYDNVGNEFFTTIEVQVVVETTTTTETNDSPFPVLSLFIGSMFLAVYRRSISKKGQ